MGVDALLVALIFSLFSFSVDHQFDGAVDDFRLLKDPFTNIHTTVRALFTMDHALVDTDVAEGMTAGCRPTAYYVVHADGAVQLVNFLERLVHSTLQAAHIGELFLKYLLCFSLLIGFHLDLFCSLSS